MQTLKAKDGKCVLVIENQDLQDSEPPFLVDQFCVEATLGKCREHQLGVWETVSLIQIVSDAIASPLGRSLIYEISFYEQSPWELFDITWASSHGVAKLTVNNPTGTVCLDFTYGVLRDEPLYENRDGRLLLPILSVQDNTVFLTPAEENAINNRIQNIEKYLFNDEISLPCARS